MLLNVLYSCNEGYAMQAGVSILSLCENNKEFKQINIYLVEDGLSEQSKQNLWDIVSRYTAKLHFYKFSEFCKGLVLDQQSRHPNTIFTKIFASQFIGIEKILYLDCDTVVKASLAELWNLDMEKNIIAGVMMPYSSKVKERANIIETNPYICDGVALIDLTRWQEENITKKCLEYIKEQQGAPPMLSEGTINHVCQGKILVLEPKYNLMSIMLLLDKKKIELLYGVKGYYGQDNLDKARKNPVVIHYLNELYNRPWNKKCDHPLRAEFRKYMNKTPWKDQTLGDGDVGMKTKLVKLGLKWLPVGVVRWVRETSKGSVF